MWTPYTLYSHVLVEHPIPDVSIPDCKKCCYGDGAQFLPVLEKGKCNCNGNLRGQIILADPQTFGHK